MEKNEKNVYITESLCYIVEINTTLIKINKFKKKYNIVNQLYFNNNINNKK